MNVQDAPNSFPKTRRVVSSADFTRILRKGTVAADDRLVVFVLPRLNSDGQPLASRIGITIPKKTGNSPTRNRWKRNIREGFRTHQTMIPDGFDIIVRPKKDATLDNKAIQKQLPKLIARAIKKR